MRDFVRRFLPRIEGEAPHRLDEEAEKVIEDEIESESVIMVGGDGLKTATGMEGVKQSVALDASMDSSSDTEEENDSSKPKEFPSWGRRAWPSFTLLSPSSNTTQPKLSPRRRAGTLPSSPAFAEVHPTSPAPDIKPTYSRTRSHSHINQHPHTSNSLGSRRSGLPPCISLGSNSKVPSTSNIPLQSPEAFAWSPVNSIPPSPSIRRSSRANSYQDLSSLVQDWTNGGPANRTYIYPLSHS